MRWTTRKAFWVGVATAAAVLAGIAVTACLLDAATGKQLTSTTVDFELRQNLIVLDAFVNGTSVKLVLDTGAGMNVFSEQAARDLQLKKKKGGARINSAGEGFSTPLVWADFLGVGSFVQEDCIFAVPDLSIITKALGNDIAGLLGHDFLRQYRVTIDYRARRLTLERHKGTDAGSADPPAEKGQRRVATVDFELRGEGNLWISARRIVLDAAVNGRLMKFVLDTGAVRTVLRERTVKALGLKETGNIQRGAIHGAYDGSLARVDSLAVGDLVYANCVVCTRHPSDKTDDDDIAGFLGSDFLSRYKVTIDYPRKRLSLEEYETEYPDKEPSSAPVQEDEDTR